MYLPLWILIIVAVIVYWVYRNSKKNLPATHGVDDIEQDVAVEKDRLFKPVHFDSPHFIDYQNAFDVMETNYLRLKQRFIHSPDNALEIARDWLRYARSLNSQKHARIMLDVDWSSDIWERTSEEMKEPTIVREEIEKKFKDLLKNDWQKIPADYFERVEKDKNSNKNLGPQLNDDWKSHYSHDKNYILMQRHKTKEGKTKGKLETSD